MEAEVWMGLQLGLPNREDQEVLQVPEAALGRKKVPQEDRSQASTCQPGHVLRGFPEMEAGCLVSPFNPSLSLCLSLTRFHLRFTFNDPL